MLIPMILLALSGQPDVSELGIRVGSSGLGELKAKVTGREDAACSEARENVTLCTIGEGFEVYQFTEEGHPAHPSGYYRGFVMSGGEQRLEERGWTAIDTDSPSTFFAASQQAKTQPKKP